MGPIEPGSGEQLDVFAVDTRVHAVAVELDFVQPVLARRRFFNEARQLRLDPFWRPIGSSHGRDRSTSCLGDQRWEEALPSCARLAVQRGSSLCSSNAAFVANAIRSASILHKLGRREPTNRAPPFVASTGRSKLAGKALVTCWWYVSSREVKGEPMRSDGRPRQGGRVLVCDDNLLMADVVAEFLRECGLEPMGPVGRLESAMRMARERALDGAILDINLNGRPCFPVCAVLSVRRIPCSSLVTRMRQFQLNTGPLLWSPSRSSRRR
jgi:hypothetical protein